MLTADESLHQVHYFTAVVHRSKTDPEQNIRQETYFRALRAVPSVLVHYGKHIPVERNGMLIKPDPASLGVWLNERVVIKTFEEKGSDVNLATRLLEDSYEGIVDHAIVLSNDTDLIAPIKSALKRIRVSVVSPDATLAGELKKAANAWWKLDHSQLKTCRLPIPSLDIHGIEVYPPRSWQTEHWPIRIDPYSDENT